MKTGSPSPTGCHRARGRTIAVRRLQKEQLRFGRLLYPAQTKPEPPMEMVVNRGNGTITFRPHSIADEQ